MRAPKNATRERTAERIRGSGRTQIRNLDMAIPVRRDQLNFFELFVRTETIHYVLPLIIFHVISFHFTCYRRREKGTCTSPMEDGHNETATRNPQDSNEYCYANSVKM